MDEKEAEARPVMGTIFLVGVISERSIAYSDTEAVSGLLLCTRAHPHQYCHVHGNKLPP